MSQVTALRFTTTCTRVALLPSTLSVTLTSRASAVPSISRLSPSSPCSTCDFVCLILSRSKAWLAAVAARSTGTGTTDSTPRWVR